MCRNIFAMSKMEVQRLRRLRKRGADGVEVKEAVWKGFEAL